jgi:hypothetical protein
VCRTFDDGNHIYVKVNPGTLALLSATERVAYMQWLSLCIVPYLCSTAPGRVRGLCEDMVGAGQCAVRCALTFAPRLWCSCAQEYLGLVRALLVMAIAIQSPVCSPAQEATVDGLIRDFRHKYKEYTAGIISGVNCKKSQYASLSSTGFMKNHVLRHLCKSRRMYGPTREHDTGVCGSSCAARASLCYRWFGKCFPAPHPTCPAPCPFLCA